jgi:hypothetical protein
MKRSLLAAALVLIPTLAGAERRVILPTETASVYDIVATEPNVDDLRFGRQVLPATGPTTTALAQSRTIYLNKNGVTVAPGNNDARVNRSSIAQTQTTIAPWNTDAATWTATVACVRELFSPFGVTVVDTDPGNVPHVEAVFGGSPTQFGMSNNVAGVSPFTTDCSIIENAMVYTFTNVIPNDARLACEIQAQEIAHAFGLDHEMLASDPMTYLNYNGNRSFKDQDAPCGENANRPCGINGSTCRPNQNSVKLLKERLGTGGSPGDTIAPTLAITSPSNNAVVPPLFEIYFDANDNVNLATANLYIDGEMVRTLDGGGTKFVTPNLNDGQYTFKIEVSDGANIEAKEITLTVRRGAAPPTPPGGGGDDAGDITGACSGGGGGSLVLSLGFAGLLLRRRRRS